MRVVFHVGMAKTGTTSIQQMLRDNRSRWPDHAVIAYERASARVRRAGQRYCQMADDAARPAFVESLDTLRKALLATGRKTAIVSDENLFNRLTTDRGRGVFDFMARGLRVVREVFADDELEIVVTTRSPAQWLRSAYAQELKRGRVTDGFRAWLDRLPFLCDWPARLSEVAEATGVPIRHVQIDGEMVEGRLGRELLRIAGLSEKQIEAVRWPARKNPALPPAALEFMRQLNLSPLGDRAVFRVSVIAESMPEAFASEGAAPPGWNEVDVLSHPCMAGVAAVSASAEAPAIKRPKPTKGRFDSAGYWQGRYAKGGKSGAGSYGRLADYKAEYINRTVSRRRINSVIEFGSGDGNQAALFTFPNYTGIDVAPLAVEACRARFADRPGWSFHLADAAPEGPFDLAMSLDVIYHLIEDEVYEAYMTRLFDSARRYVLIYASDFDGPGPARHVRHRAFSDWVARNRPRWKLVEAPEHPYPMTEGSDPNETSFAAFKLFKAPA